MFYCLNAEFYDYGAVKARLTARRTDQKPKNQYRHVHGLSAFRVWFGTEDKAVLALRRLLNGELDLDDVLALYFGVREAA